MGIRDDVWTAVLIIHCTLHRVYRYIGTYEELPVERACVSSDDFEKNNFSFQAEMILSD